MSLHCQLGVQQNAQVTNYWLVTDNNVIVDLQQAIRGCRLEWRLQPLPNQISSVFDGFSCSRRDEHQRWVATTHVRWWSGCRQLMKIRWAECHQHTSDNSDDSWWLCSPDLLYMLWTSLVLTTNLAVHCSLTRSSADADNRLDAFNGQSRSTNMVPFHM